MKRIMFLAVIIACLSTAYYFTIFLPKIRDFEMSEKCAKKANEFFRGYNNPYSSDSYDYSCHYNKKLNKCFVEIRSVVNQPKIYGNNFFLFDAYEGVQYAEYRKLVNTGETRKLDDIPPQQCSVSGKTCNSTKEYEDLIRPYKTE